MKTLGKFAALLTACALAACNDKPAASAAPTPPPGAANTATTATPIPNPAGGTTGGVGGKYPAESAKTYPATESAK